MSIIDNANRSGRVFYSSLALRKQLEKAKNHIAIKKFIEKLDEGEKGVEISDK